jgi:hypothetical protein
MGVPRWRGHTEKFLPGRQCVTRDRLGTEVGVVPGVGQGCLRHGARSAGPPSVPLCLWPIRALLTPSAPLARVCLQDLASLDVTKLTPLSPEVISRQATINIGALVASCGSPWPRACTAFSARSVHARAVLGPGCASQCGVAAHVWVDLTEAAPCLCPDLPGTIGHVAHGKSTVVKAISGVQVRNRRRPLRDAAATSAAPVRMLLRRTLR